MFESEERKALKKASRMSRSSNPSVNALYLPSILTAAVAGDINTIKKRIQDKDAFLFYERLLEDMNEDEFENGEYASILYTAARNGHMHLVQYLKEQGADIQETCFDRGSEEDNTLIEAATMGGHHDLVKYLIPLSNANAIIAACEKALKYKQKHIATLLFSSIASNSTIKALAADIGREEKMQSSPAFFPKTLYAASTLDTIKELLGSRLLSTDTLVDRMVSRGQLELPKEQQQAQQSYETDEEPLATGLRSMTP